MEHPEISRVDLVRITELNKATITNIIRDFLEMGIVKAIGQISSSNGRKVVGEKGCKRQSERKITGVVRLQ